MRVDPGGSLTELKSVRIDQRLSEALVRQESTDEKGTEPKGTAPSPQTPSPGASNKVICGRTLIKAGSLVANGGRTGLQS